MLLERLGREDRGCGLLVQRLGHGGLDVPGGDGVDRDAAAAQLAGKLADLVVLDQDPRQADPDSLKDIRVLET